VCALRGRFGSFVKSEARRPDLRGASGVLFSADGGLGGACELYFSACGRLAQDLFMEHGVGALRGQETKTFQFWICCLQHERNCYSTVQSLAKSASTFRM
jgi:hypothetical protein